MKINDYLKGLTNKRNLIDEVKEVIINGSIQKNKTLRKSGITTEEDVFGLLINHGSISLSSGDIDAFRHFIAALYEIMEANPSYVEKISEHVERFSYLVARERNVYNLSSIIQPIIGNIQSLETMDSVNEDLKSLGKLASICEGENFDAGVLEVIQSLGVLHKHFEDEGKHVNDVYLKNLVISIIASVERKGNRELLEQLTSQTRELLNIASMSKDANINAKYVEQNAEASQSTVVPE
jgi:hypothetical protein